MSENGRDIVWLDVSDVVLLHAAMMRERGRAPQPLRDAGGLESAVMRPRMLAYYEGEHDIVELAAVLGSGISQVQAFLDGNKRTAFVSMRVFPDQNGLRFATDPIDVAKQLEAIAEGPDRGAATAAFGEWLRANVAPRTP